VIATAVFAASVAYMVYILFGYPALLGLLARRFAKPVRRDGELRSVSFIIAVRDGERWIERKLRSIVALDYPKELMEIIVASDGSSDRTEPIAAAFPDHPVRVLSLPPEGKGAALNAAIPVARNEILVLTDVRQDLEPDSLARMVSFYADPSVGAVSGELRIRSGATQQEEHIGLYRRYENWIRSKLSTLDSIFGATGSFYSMRRELAGVVPPDTLLDDMYLPLVAYFRGYRLLYENSARAYDVPTSLDNEFPRKLRTLAGNLQIMRMFPALLTPRNRMLFHFLSYKFGRLLLPYAMMAATVSAFWLPDPVRWPLVAGMAAFYLAAAVDVVLPEGFPLKKLTSAVRTFLVLMAADLCAIVILFVPPSKLWKPTQLRSSTAMR
jgi:cellulose synthase/poly-beta-1,6-N-acetylglucosamine synthase-like glycosyltransferase